MERDRNEAWLAFVVIYTACRSHILSTEIEIMQHIKQEVKRKEDSSVSRGNDERKKEEIEIYCERVVKRKEMTSEKSCNALGSVSVSFRVCVRTNMWTM